MQYRSVTDAPVEIRSDGGSDIIQGYAIVWDSLSHDLGGYRERVNRKSVERSMREIKEGTRTVSARVQHEGGLSTVGTTGNGSLRLSSDSKGLKYEILRPPNTNAGRDIVELVRDKYITKSSFAFTAPTGGIVYDWSTDPPVRELMDINLIDVAPVDGPAYEATTVEARSIVQTEMELAKPVKEQRPQNRVEVRATSSGGQAIELHILDEIVPTWVSRYMQDAMSIGKVLDVINETPDAERIDVYINSPGGDVFEGWAIYNALKEHPAPVNVTVRGLAASIAGVIAMAGDTITMGEGTMLMLHRAWTGIAGNAGDLRKEAILLDKIDGDISNMIAKRSGSTPEQVTKWMIDETWMTADEALVAGLADRKSGPAETIDGERCRAMEYRNIPASIGGPGKITVRQGGGVEDYRAAVAHAMKRKV